MFRKWVKDCFDNLVDPDKGAEVEQLTQLLYANIKALKQNFVLRSVLGDRPYQLHHLDLARTRLYQKLLNRAWNDGRMTPDERMALDWMAKCLELDPTVQTQLNLERARLWFAESLADAMEDGEITPVEMAKLEEIAQAANLTARQFINGFFRSKGVTFLRGVFAGSLANGQLRVDDFERLMATAERLGMTRPEVLDVIQPQAIQYIEHVLTDAKEDDELTPNEESALRGLMKSLRLPDYVCEHVESEIRELQLITDAKKGKLPSLDTPRGVSLKAGELVHFHSEATWVCLKMTRNGQSRTDHNGRLILTDARLVFNASTRSHAIGLSRVVGHDFSHGTIEVQVQGKPTDRFICEGYSRTPYLLFCSALNMANQKLTNSEVSRPTRHIPREVRQRVWQRYSGQCAECNATNYLEFDHIVPVAKGGSNSDANVQLLCRNCNLKKSDMI